MAHTGTRGGQHLGRLTEEQWHDLMRSLIEDVDAPRDDDTESLLLQDVASHDHGGGRPSTGYPIGRPGQQRILNR